MNIVANVAYMRTTQEIVQLRVRRPTATADAIPPTFRSPDSHSLPPPLSTQTWVTDGPAFCRILGFLGGCFVFFRSTLQLLIDLAAVTTWPPLVLHEFLSALIGLATALMECRALLCSLYIRKRTREYLKICSFLWGRGLVYIAAGAFFAIRYPALTDVVVAVYFLVVSRDDNESLSSTDPKACTPVD